MPRKKLDTIDLEEFECRLDANNERMRLEILELEEHNRKWEALIARKGAFLARLDQTIVEMEHEDAEIAEMEKELPPLRRNVRRRQPISPVLQ